MKSHAEFVAKYYPVAAEAVKGTKLFPELVLGAALLESASGKSELSSRYNNFFGMKTGHGYHGKYVQLQTIGDEIPKEDLTDTGKHLAVFRAYDTPEDSFKDYVKLLTNSKRYAGVQEQNTIEGQAQALQEAGYSTNPQYAAKVSALGSLVKKYIPVIMKHKNSILVVSLVGALIMAILKPFKHGKG